MKALKCRPCSPVQKDNGTRRDICENGCRRAADNRAIGITIALNAVVVSKSPTKEG